MTIARAAVLVEKGAIVAAKAYYVYLLSNTTGTLYVGMTNNLVRRIWQHREKLVPGFTSKYDVSRLLHAEMFMTPLEAIAREKQIKGWTRAKKLTLIRASNPQFRELTVEDAL